MIEGLTRGGLLGWGFYPLTTFLGFLESPSSAESSRRISDDSAMLSACHVCRKHAWKSAFQSMLTTQTVCASAIDPFDGRNRFVLSEPVVVVAPFTDYCLLLLLPLLRLRLWRSGDARRPFFDKLVKKVSLTIINARPVPF